MPSKRTGTNQRQLKQIIFILTLMLLVCFALYWFIWGIVPSAFDPPPVVDLLGDADLLGDVMSVMFINVGQGDSILVCFGTNDVMLIDAGEADETPAIKEELDERGITQIDVLVATHPHADHIGGMKQIINSYDIGSVYMPDMTSDSKTYRELRNEIKKRGIPLTIAYAGETFDIGPADCTIVSPDKNDDKDTNDESVMLMLDYMDTEFLFTGDAEKWAEKQVLEAGYVIDADVLKMGHHGSSSSTSEEFLKAVSPQYAVISCGKNNDYGHPHKETLSLLSEYGITTLRTDISGDVLILSDGYTLQSMLGD